MAACTFTLRFDTTADLLFQAARDSILSQGGTFTGAPQAGSASLPTNAGTVYWNYRTSGQALTVEVTDKPWLVSCAAIQQQMAEVIAAAPNPKPIDTVAEAVPRSAPTPAPAPGQPPVVHAPTLTAPNPPSTLVVVGGTLALLALIWAWRRNLSWR